MALNSILLPQFPKGWDYRNVLSIILTESKKKAKWCSIKELLVSYIFLPRKLTTRPPHGHRVGGLSIGVSEPLLGLGWP